MLQLPILCDTAWLQSLVDLVSKGHKNGWEMQGVYNSLLAYCFPVGHMDDFLVAPYPRMGQRRGTTEFSEFYKSKRPVIYVDVENRPAPPWHVDSRVDADERMRGRLEIILPECSIPTLYGFSVMGTKMRAYSVEVATREVTCFQKDRKMDITLQEAFNQVKGIISDITTAVEKIQ